MLNEENELYKNNCNELNQNYIEVFENILKTRMFNPYEKTILLYYLNKFVKVGCCVDKKEISNVLSITTETAEKYLLRLSDLKILTKNIEKSFGYKPDKIMYFFYDNENFESLKKI